MTLDVDRGTLRDFAANLDTASNAIGRLTVDPIFTAAADALPGTDVGAVVRQCGQAVADSVRGVTDRLTAMSTTAHGSAGNYQVAEDGFTQALRSVQL